MDTLVPTPSPALPREDRLQALARGFRASLLSLLLIAAINTGIAAVLWIEDTRPFWHPLVTCQLYGFSIAYCVNVASPWDRPHAILRLLLAVATGVVLGVLLVILVKQYDMPWVQAHWQQFAWNMFSAFLNGLFVSLFFLVKLRDSRAEVALQRANAERSQMSRHAVEAELKLMQAQVEPHFLFNTLASVQYLIETDPPRAGRLLDHLIGYLRAALPQLRAASSTLGQEAKLIDAYLNILKMRMGDRLAFAVDIPEALRAEPFPPNLLISLVENAVRHGLEPRVEGGQVTVDAAREAGLLLVRVADSGGGLADGPSATAGQGVGLANVRERLAALYGPRARFTLGARAGGGAMATIAIPSQAR